MNTLLGPDRLIGNSEGQTIKLSVSEYIEAFDVCDSTVRNRIRKKQVEAEMIGGKWYIVVDSQALPKSYVMASGNPTTVTTQSDGQPDSQLDGQSDNSLLLESRQQQIDQLQETITVLKDRLKQSDIRAERDQSIIMRQTLLLEQKSTSIWQRIKGIFTGNEVNA